MSDEQPAGVPARSAPPDFTPQPLRERLRKRVTWYQSAAKVVDTLPDDTADDGEPTQDYVMSGDLAADAACDLREAVAALSAAEGARREVEQERDRAEDMVRTLEPECVQLAQRLRETRGQLEEFEGLDANRLESIQQLVAEAKDLREQLRETTRQRDELLARVRALGVAWKPLDERDLAELLHNFFDDVAALLADGAPEGH